MNGKADAERVYRQILAAEPGNAQALFTLGTIALVSHEFASAVDWLSKAAAENPNDAVYLARLGEANRHLGQLAEALRWNHQAIQLNPLLSEAHLSMALAHQQQGDTPTAIATLRNAQRLIPGSVPLATNLARLLQAQGDFAGAEAALRLSVSASPGDATAHVAPAAALRGQGKLLEACIEFRTALAIDPENAAAHNDLGITLRDLGREDEAETHLLEAIRLRPHSADIHSNLALIYSDEGRMADAMQHRRVAVTLAPTNHQAHSNLLVALHYDPAFDAETIWKEHRAWAIRHADPLSAAAAPHANDRSPGRRLRIGYVSAHFRAHAVNFFVEPILASHDHAAFEVFCYSNVAPSRCDETTNRLRGHADAWREIVGLSDERAAALVREDAIDILVDLAGYIDGGRPLIFARKPAPVQVSYIGYQNTTGMIAMDYRLTDDWSDPPGTTDRFYTEKLVRLPRAFFCYLPSHDAPPVAPLPASSGQGVTFGSFNKIPKVTPQMLSLWAEILRAVTGSRMLIVAKSSRGLEDYVRDVFAQHGVAGERVEFSGWRPRHDYLRLMDRVDVALATYPFNGHTTTCDALWQGLPVVSLAGETYVSRYGSSALVTLDRREWVAETPQAYAEIAVRLASDLGQLAEIRRTLRDSMRRSALLDGRQFTGHLEAAYRQMWADWCRQPA